MPRKTIPRAFKLVCKHYKGFDRHFTAKAIAARKFHASQGVIVNQKLAAAPDYKYGTSTGRPLVRSYASSYPSFAAQPLAVRTRHASSLAGLQPAGRPVGTPTPAAPSFAAAPLWQRQQHDSQPSTSSAADTVMADAPRSAPQGSPFKPHADPLYQYATLDQPQSPVRSISRRDGRKQERNALKWYGGLDRRSISKVSGSPSKQAAQSDHARLAAAFAAYADLDGPKH